MPHRYRNASLRRRERTNNFYLAAMKRIAELTAAGMKQTSIEKIMEAEKFTKMADLGWSQTLVSRLHLRLLSLQTIGVTPAVAATPAATTLSADEQSAADSSPPADDTDLPPPVGHQADESLDDYAMRFMEQERARQFEQIRPAI